MGAAGASYLDTAALCSLGTARCPNGANEMEVGSAPAGSGFVNSTSANIAAGAARSPPSRPRVSERRDRHVQPGEPLHAVQSWPTTPIRCGTRTARDASADSCVGPRHRAPRSVGSCEVCGAPYATEAPPRHGNRREIWLYAGGGGGGYDGAGQGGNGAAAMVDFNTVPQRLLRGQHRAAAAAGAGPVRAATAHRMAAAPVAAPAGTRAAAAGAVAPSASTGDVHHADLCQHHAACPVTPTTIPAASAPCLLAVVGGGGVQTPRRANGGGSATTTWCTTNGFSAASGAECNGNAGGSSGAAGGASWFANNGSAPPARFQPNSGDRACNSSGTGTHHQHDELVPDPEHQHRFPPNLLPGSTRRPVPDRVESSARNTRAQAEHQPER